MIARYVDFGLVYEETACLRITLIQIDLRDVFDQGDLVDGEIRQIVEDYHLIIRQ